MLPKSCSVPIQNSKYYVLNEIDTLTSQFSFSRFCVCILISNFFIFVGFLSKVKDTADSRIQAGLTNTASPDTQRKLTGIMNKVKEGAEKAKGELEKAVKELDKPNEVKNGDENGLRPNSLQLEINLTLEIGQLLLSALHAWGLDKDLDRVALNKLGLLRPKLSLCFGLVSKTGAMSLSLPTWCPRPSSSHTSSATEYFTSLGHWELSHTLTTQHLLSLIAITNTLMSVSNASFVPEQDRVATNNSNYLVFE